MRTLDLERLSKVLLLLLLMALTGCRPAPPQQVTPDRLSPTASLPDTSTTTPSSTPSTSPPPRQDDIEAQIARLEQQESSVETSVVATRHRPAWAKKPKSDLPLKLPGPDKATQSKDAELEQLLTRAESSDTAADWRMVADRAVGVHDFQTAHKAFARESQIYQQKGFLQAALAERVKSDQYATELAFYVPFKPSNPKTLARLEPARGCLVGAFIDRDRNLETHVFQSQTHGDIEDFNEITQKKHASFFMYRAFGKPFPTEWAEYVKSQNAVVHIAWEPKSVEEVFDETYVRDFVDRAQALDHPVMLRFASEMNGEWTGYNGDPEGYKKAFRFIFKETRRAPKVALLWCPNAVPQSTIKDYYPGDDHVDWVGVNFYSVPFLDNNSERPGDKIHPTDHMRYVYETYSPSKPIAIGEWAASHQSSLVERDLTSFATTKIAQLYSTLPTRYPRVKMVNWYDCNNIVHAQVERRLNNFQITGSKPVLESYRRAVDHHHFLGAADKAVEVGYKKVSGPVRLAEQDEIRLFLKSYDPTLKVYFRVDDQIVHASADPLSWYVTSEQLASKPTGELDVVVFDSKDRYVTESSISYTLVKTDEN